MADILEFPENKIYRNVPESAVKETYKKSLKKDADNLRDDIFATITAILEQVECLGGSEDDCMDTEMMNAALTNLIYRKYGLSPEETTILKSSDDEEI